MEIEIIVPEGLHDIKLEQYQKFLALQSEDDMFLAQKCVEIFCNVPLILVDRMPYNKVRELSNRIYSYLQTKPQLVMRTKLRKREFGFVPNLEQISLGEFTDIDSNITDWKNMHRVMAVLYRPVVTYAGDYYDIEEYDGTDKYADLMKQLPLDVALSALVFFYRLGMDLLECMTAYLEDPEIRTSLLKGTSEKSGAGIVAFTHSLREMQQNLKGLVDSQFTPL